MLARRSFVLLGGCIALSGLGCKRATASPSSCEDTSSLTDEERAARTALAYADRVSAPEKSCNRCQHWVAPTEDGACGGCKLLKGPIHPTGSCKAFALKG